MPVDRDGNITTIQSVDVKTLHDVITTEGQDVLMSMFGGMIRIPRDLGNVNGVELGAVVTAPVG